ncbi:hypothetical protein [uncultured Paraglaciecola sp.]|uniref:hypothetical protein n=1 Tax=uncultured Paraglaciecola sp. TaxID=1765024 RepID=UPI0030DD470C|tara:strand:- start:5511 stop:5768 length:258 start_codon:yes stop_codon:yes gene_type:complete
MKSFALERLLFGYFILSCRRKSDWLEGIQVKNAMDCGKRSACFGGKAVTLKSKTISGRRAGRWRQACFVVTKNKTTLPKLQPQGT